jgi:hypothetical protein
MIEFLSQAKHSRPESSTLRNETRAAGLHYFIESLSSLNAIDFVQCVFRKGRDVKILPRAGRGSRRCKESRATLYRPSQQHCAGVFPTRAAIAEMTGSSSGPALMP